LNEVIGIIIELVRDMEFEFDPQKSQSNQAKHGTDFLEAQQLWADLDRIEVPAQTENESRFVVIGKIKDKHWTAVITYRHNRIRLISVRRARVEEVKVYENRSI
jgi:uncharacterized protein